jgi:heme/copper-type cytochrome/quinol oxidase subunit 1
MPRRTALSIATYGLPSWWLAGIMAAIGGTIMFTSVLLFFVNLVMTIAAGEHAAAEDISLTVTIQAPAIGGWTAGLNNLRLGVTASVVLCLAVYGPFLLAYLPPHLSILPLKYP